MKMGVNHEQLAGSLAEANEVFMYAPDGLKWNTDELSNGKTFRVCHDFEAMLKDIVNYCQAGDVILVMSNGGFNGIQGKLLTLLGQKK